MGENHAVYAVCWADLARAWPRDEVRMIVHNYPGDKPFQSLEDAEAFAKSLSENKLTVVHKFSTSHYPKGGDEMSIGTSPESIFIDGVRYTKG